MDCKRSNSGEPADILAPTAAPKQLAGTVETLQGKRLCGTSSGRVVWLGPADSKCREMRLMWDEAGTVVSPPARLQRGRALPGAAANCTVSSQCL